MKILKHKKSSLLPKLPIDEEIESDDEPDTPVVAKRSSRKSALNDAFANVPLTQKSVDDGTYTGQLESIRREDSTRLQAVFVKASIDLGKNGLVEAKWMLLNTSGQANEVVPERVRQLFQRDTNSPKLVFICDVPFQFPMVLNSRKVFGQLRFYSWLFHRDHVVISFATCTVRQRLTRTAPQPASLSALIRFGFFRPP